MAVKKKYEAIFSCGHKAFITYSGKYELMQRLSKAEKTGLCPKCALEDFKANSEMFTMPFREYKQKFAKRRGVRADNYNPQSKTIDVYMSPLVAQVYKEEKSRRCFDAELVSNYDNCLIELFVKGNSFLIKDELKQLGFKWSGKRWSTRMIVFPKVNDLGNKYLPIEDNPQFFTMVNSLKNLGCKEDLISLDLEKTK